MAENNEQPPRRLNRGRQKVAMMKMANDSNLQVTFSKRRTGLFKKASELCTLCGAEMALIVFSPGKKVFSFGHPSVEVVLDRYTGTVGDGSPFGADAAAIQLFEAHRSVGLRDMNAQLAQLTVHVDTERKRGEQMNRQRREAVEAQRWWECPPEKMANEGQLRQFYRALEELKQAVAVQTENIVIETTAAASAAAAAMAYGNGNGQIVSLNNNSNMNDNNINNGRGFF